MILCTGSSLIDCIMTEQGDSVVAENIGLYPGGEALNEAVALSRLGEDVLFSAAVGDDLAGSALKSFLEKERLLHVPDDYRGATPVSLLIVDSTGNRKSRTSKVHVLEGYEPAVPDAEIAFATMASLFRAPFLDPAACLRYAKKIKERGIPLLADTKLPKGTDPTLEEYREVLPLLDFITPNEDEAKYYTHTETALDAAKVWRSYGVKNVIVKCGEKGCLCLTEDGEVIEIPAYQVECVDGVGAGDNFNAGLIYSLTQGSTLREALEFGTACAAISVTKAGAGAALQSAWQVREFMKTFLPETVI